MRARGAVVVALLAVLAVVVQGAVVARLPLPGSPPDLVLVLVVAVALRAGPRAGMPSGFGAGLRADLVGSAELGRLAFALVLAGGLAGLLQDDVRDDGGSPLVAALAGGAAALVAVCVVAAQGVLLGDAPGTGGALWRSLASVVPYSAALTPVVVPPVAAVLRRADRRL